MPNPLTPSLYARIRPRRYAADRVVSFFGNDVVLTGRITSDLVTPKVWGDFNYDMSTGDYNDVRPDMYLLMGTANDIRQATYIEGRARYDTIAGAVATASKVYCNESSVDFAPNSGWFWIVNNHMPQIRLSTEDQATRTQKADWNQPYQGIPPRISGVRMVYADYVNPLTGKLRIAVDMSSSAAQESGRSLASILTSIEGCAVLAGSLSSLMFIADIDPGVQWAETTLADNGGVEQTRYWFIHAANDDFPPFVGALGNTIENRLDSGWTMTLPAISGVDDLLPNTFAAAWRTNQQTILADGTWKTGDLWGGASADITNKVLTSNVATLTTDDDHDFLPGQSLIVIINDSVFNGTHTIAAVTANTVSFALVHANVSSASATGMAATNADNVDFGGWLQTENDPDSADMKYSVLSQANLTFAGIGPRMAKLFGQQLGFLNTASATTYEQIVNCTPYRTVARFLASYTTAATLANIDYDAYDNTYLFPACIIQAGDMLSAVKALLYQINALVEWSGNGGLHIGRDATFLDAGERVPLPVLLSWTAADPMGQSALTRDSDPNPGTGKVDADGTFYQIDIAATGQVFTSRAPGTAQGSGAGNDSLRNQILAATSSPGDALDELKLRAGALLDYDNLNEFLHSVHRDATVGLNDWASHTRFYEWALDGTEAGPNNVNRIGPYDSTIKWLLDSRASTYNPDKGTFDEKRDYRRLIDPASPGDDTTQLVPDPGSVEPALPDFALPAFPYQDAGLGYPEEGLPLAEIPPAALAPPTTGGSLKMDGNELFTWSDTSAYLNKNVVLRSTPEVIDITPPDLDSFEIKQICTDPFSNFPYTPGAYLLAYDSGADKSAVWYTSDGTSAAGWVKGDEIDGEYTVMRAGKTAGYIAIYSPDNSANWTETFDFTTGAHGWAVALNGHGVPVGAYTGSTGFTEACVGGYTDPLDSYTMGLPAITIASTTVTAISFTYDLTAGVQDSPVGPLIAVNGNPTLFVDGSTTIASTPGISGTNQTLAWTGSMAMTNIALAIWSGYRIVNPCVGDGGSGTLKAATISGLGSNPFGGGTGGATVVYSTGHGATWGAPVPAGATPGGVGGFDVQPSGANAFAAADNIVSRATAVSGSFAPYYTITGGTAQAACIIMPYRTYSGSLNISNANPDVIVALTAADGSGRTLIEIEGGATPGTIRDLNVPAGLVFDNPNCVTVSFNHHLLVFGKISGVSKVYRSTNRGVTWTLVSSTAASFIRCRRQDNTATASASNKGQCFLAGASGVLGFTKTWALNGFKPRIWPGYKGSRTDILMRTTTERVNALESNFRRMTNQSPEQAIIGDVSGVLRYATTPPSCVECRVYTTDSVTGAKTLSGPRPIFFPKNVNVTLKPGTTVYVGWRYGRECILDPNTIAATASGVDSTTATMTAQNSSTPQGSIATLKCIASATPDMFVHLQAWNPTVDKVYYDVGGYTTADLSSFVPPAGNMCVIVVAVLDDFSDVEVAASTPRPISTIIDIGASDINEALAGLISTSTEVWAIKLTAGQTVITQASIDNMPSRDLRPVVNVNATQPGGKITASGTATLALGVATVSTAAITASSLIFLTAQETGTYTGFLRVSSRSAGVSFGIASSVLTDTAVIAWQILEP